MNAKVLLASFIMLFITLPGWGSDYFRKHSKLPGSEYYWKYGREAGSSHFWKYGRETGSLYFWNNGREIGSSYFWKYGREAGSLKYWNDGDGPGSKYYWLNGDGPGSSKFWRNGRDPSFAPFFVSLCKGLAISIEPCEEMNVAVSTINNAISVLEKINQMSNAPMIHESLEINRSEINKEIGTSRKPSIRNNGASQQ